MRDNYDMWEAHDAEQERKLQRLPKCKICREPIQQEQAVLYDGDWYCEECEEELWEEMRKGFLERL